MLFVEVIPLDPVKRIFALVDKKYSEQRDFAADLGIAPSVVSAWRCRKSSSYVKRLEKISAVLGTTPQYLLTGDGPAIKPSGTVSESDTGIPQGAERLDLDAAHRIPILGRISAGTPLYADEHIEGYTLTDLDGGAEYFALRVSGDSMNAARMQDGDILIVRRQEEVENGEVAVVMVGEDDATVKRFYSTGTTVTLMPQSTNPDHQPQIYDIAKTQIRVIGRVVKVEFTL